VRTFIIGDKAFDLPDGKRIIKFTPAAGLFAGMGAYPAADAGEYVILPYQLQGFFITTGPGQSDISLGVNSQRAGTLA
jgi:hypothetical protein